MYITTVHAASLYTYIFKDNEIRKSIFATENPRATFIECFKTLIGRSDLASSLLEIKCSKGHSHVKFIERSAFTIFNISSKNFVSNLNDELREKQAAKSVEKRNKNQMKIQ